MKFLDNLHKIMMKKMKIMKHSSKIMSFLLKINYKAKIKIINKINKFILQMNNRR